MTSNQLTLESFHRIILKSKIYEKKTLLDLLENNPQVKEIQKIFPIKKNEIKIYINDRWFRFKINLNKKNKDTIPIFVLSNKILQPVLNEQKLQTIGKIHYIPNSKLNLEKASKKNNLIFLLPNIKNEEGIFKLCDRILNNKFANIRLNNKNVKIIKII